MSVLKIRITSTGSLEAIDSIKGEKGDRVHYPDADGPVYESMIDNKVWSTDAYPVGWKEIE